ncbi:hypothetical protein SGPA1_10639 [Streptomyces misionensis JCM 4497]
MPGAPAYGTPVAVPTAPAAKRDRPRRPRRNSPPEHLGSRIRTVCQYPTHRHAAQVTAS